jgi:electron-transferring-flavoprotein dehydrogenase
MSAKPWSSTSSLSAPDRQGSRGDQAEASCRREGKELSVVVLEKGSEVGAHILSGAVIDPVGLDALIPDWRDKGSSLTTKVSEDKFYYLWKTAASACRTSSCRR